MSAMKPILERRMMKYSAEEIHFNLMAVVCARLCSFNVIIPLVELSEAINYTK